MPDNETFHTSYPYQRGFHLMKDWNGFDAAR
jgi:hypothetical protein